jgi:hypothetical protein
VGGFDRDRFRAARAALVRRSRRRQSISRSPGTRNHRGTAPPLSGDPAHGPEATALIVTSCCSQAPIDLEARKLFENKPEPAAIYAYLPPEEMTEEESPFKVEHPKLHRPPHKSPRIQAQRGVFSVSVDPTNRLIKTDDEIRKYQISAETCFDIKRSLDACGINRATLCPDLDGLCDTLACGTSGRVAKLVCRSTEFSAARRG